MKKRDEILLRYIQGQAALLLRLMKEYDWHRFQDDELAQNGVSMILIKLGESVKLLSKDLKDAHSDVRWVSITNLRNIAAHNYEGLHMDRIWGNVTKDVPELLEQVNNILHAEGVEEGK